MQEESCDYCRLEGERQQQLVRVHAGVSPTEGHYFTVRAQSCATCPTNQKQGEIYTMLTQPNEKLLYNLRKQLLEAHQNKRKEKNNTIQQLKKMRQLERESNRRPNGQRVERKMVADPRQVSQKIHQLQLVLIRNRQLQELLDYFLLPIDILLALLLYATISLQIIFICVHFNESMAHDYQRNVEALAIYFLLLGLPLLNICLYFQCEIQDNWMGYLQMAGRLVGLVALLPVNILMLPLVLPITALEKQQQLEMRSQWVLPHPRMRWWIFLTLEGAMASFVGMGSYASQIYTWSSYSENSVDSLAIFTSTLTFFALPLMSLRLKMNCQKITPKSYYLNQGRNCLMLATPSLHSDETTPLNQPTPQAEDYLDHPDHQEHQLPLQVLRREEEHDISTLEIMPTVPQLPSMMQLETNQSQTNLSG